MAYCSKCGQQILDEAVICTHCGCAVAGALPYPRSAVSETEMDRVDTGSFGWLVLGFLWPLVGFILFCIWKRTQPNNAKKVGLGALIGFILTLVITIISVVLVISLVNTAIAVVPQLMELFLAPVPVA